MQTAEYARNYAYEASYWWFVGRRALIQATLLPLVNGRRATLLDVGCGTGYDLGLFAQQTASYGVDIAAEALAFCRQRGLQRLTQCWAENLPFREASFDVVTALDVLEHLDDDVAALREWHRICRPGGHLLLFVPALPLLWSGEDYVSRHRRRYLRRQLAKRVQKAGFSLRRLTYANCLLLPGVVATILCNRLFRPHTLRESNLQPLPGWLNRLLAAIFVWEARWLARFDAPLGSSLFCLAQKPFGAQPGK